MPSGLARGRNRGESPRRHFKSYGVLVPLNALFILDGPAEHRTLLVLNARTGCANFHHLEPGPGQDHSPLDVYAKVCSRESIAPPDRYLSTPASQSGWHSSDLGLSGWRNPATHSPQTIRARSSRIEVPSTSLGKAQSCRRQGQPIQKDRLGRSTDRAEIARMLPAAPPPLSGACNWQWRRIANLLRVLRAAAL